METIVGGNIFIRKGQIEMAGETVDGHEHNFDHVTIVKSGSMRIEQLDEAGNVVRSVEKVASANNSHVLILAGAIHRLTALEDNSSYWCVYAHRDPQGELVEHYDGWKEAYE